ncbi:MAG: DUF1385 domain-containing protein [Ruminococcus sp.]|nr:DUF1385 domain-containing protein [Ruminococcus sp.]MDY6059583.1 DUF1385 domain-containing protein [Candidatus Fimenecus sp.]
MSNQVSKKHKTSVGGQALIEGIMMRGPKGAAMSVRLPNGTIETEYKDVKPWREKNKFFSLPLVRGIVGFVESLVTGYGYLMESAEKSTQGLENPPEEELSKFDKWIEKHFGEKMMNIVGVISAVLGFGIAFFLFMWLPSFVVDKVTFGKLLEFHPLFEGIIRIIIFVLYMLAVSYMKDIHRVFMYHGAEHKSIFCYENGLELTVENVRKQSRFHPRCGTSFMFVMILLSILLSSALVLIFPNLADINRMLWILIKLLIMPLVMGIGYEFIKYAGKHDNLLVKILSAPGLWMQRITTKEPTDDIIEVGIEAIKAVLTDNPEDDEIK